MEASAPGGQRGEKRALDRESKACFLCSAWSCVQPRILGKSLLYLSLLTPSVKHGGFAHLSRTIERSQAVGGMAAAQIMVAISAVIRKSSTTPQPCSQIFSSQSRSYLSTPHTLSLLEHGELGPATDPLELWSPNTLPTRSLLTEPCCTPN
jgi:hypothetical protein